MRRESRRAWWKQLWMLEELTGPQEQTFAELHRAWASEVEAAQRNLWTLRLRLGRAAQAEAPAGVVDWEEANLRRGVLGLARLEWRLRIRGPQPGRTRCWVLEVFEGRPLVRWAQPMAAGVAQGAAESAGGRNLLAKDQQMSPWSLAELCWIGRSAAKRWMHGGWVVVGMELAMRLRLQVRLRLPGYLEPRLAPAREERMQSSWRLTVGWRLAQGWPTQLRCLPEVEQRPAREWEE